jgi:CRISPR/Cas system CMR subunit Cmr4 (Cas7 group RAMP superfamily)
MSNANLSGLSDEAMMAWRMNHFARITQQHLANRAAAAEEAVQREQQDIENRAVMAKILEENRQKAVMDAYKMRELENKNLEEDLKRKFMANPAATENAWLMAKAEVKQNYFIQQMNAEATSEELMRQTGNYGAM